MIYVLYGLLMVLSLLIGASLWNSFKSTSDKGAKQKATTLTVIAFGLILVWLIYAQLGNAALVSELPY